MDNLEGLRYEFQDKELGDFNTDQVITMKITSSYLQVHTHFNCVIHKQQACV